MLSVRRTAGGMLPSDIGTIGSSKRGIAFDRFAVVRHRTDEATGFLGVMALSKPTEIAIVEPPRLSEVRQAHNRA
jgi:hypothetical protein